MKTVQYIHLVHQQWTPSAEDIPEGHYRPSVRCRNTVVVYMDRKSERETTPFCNLNVETGSVKFGETLFPSLDPFDFQNDQGKLNVH